MRAKRAIDESKLNILSRTFPVSMPPSNGVDLDGMPTLPNPGPFCGVEVFRPVTGCFVPLES